MAVFRKFKGPNKNIVIGTPNRHFLIRNDVIWRILRKYPSRGVGCSLLLVFGRWLRWQSSAPMHGTLLTAFCVVTHPLYYLHQYIPFFSFQSVCHILQRENLTASSNSLCQVANHVQYAHYPSPLASPPDFSVFLRATEDEIIKLISDCPNKQCGLD